MDPLAEGEEQLDYEDEEDYGGGVQKKHLQTVGAISALADEEELLGEDEEYDDLYNDVNVGESFMQSVDRPDLRGAGNVAEQNDFAPGIESQQREANEPGIDGGGLEEKPLRESDVNDSAEKKVGVADKEQDEDEDEYAGVDSGSNPMQSAAAPVLKEAEAEAGGGEQIDARNGNLGYRGSVGTVKGSDAEGSGLDEDRASGKGRGSTFGAGGGRGGPGSGPSRGGVSNRLSSNENTGRHGASNSQSGEGGGAMLFVGELHWWTTDAELESVLSEYGRLKELKFFDEKASGKSKGYCQVEFYDAAAAAACKEGMNGHVFNGRPCVVAFASPQTVRQMGTAQVNKGQAQSQAQTQAQPRKMMNDGGGRGGSFYQGGEGGRNYGKMGWGRGGGHGQSMGNRGQGGQGIGRGVMGAKNMGGSGGGGGGGASSSGGHYGQGLPGPPMGGPPGGMMHPQGILAQGFDPTYGAHMGRAGGYGGFSTHGPPFTGMIPSFPAVGTVGLPGVAPHVNPAFFGRGVAANGMGMMPSGGMEGHQAGMWADSGIGGWGGDDHNRRMRDASYAEDPGSEYGYSDITHERGGRSSVPRDKERGASERRRHDDRDTDWDRDLYREGKDGYKDQRQRERDWENEDDWEKEKSSRSRSKARIVEEEDPRPRSKEADYGKRRRLPAVNE